MTKLHGAVINANIWGVGVAVSDGPMMWVCAALAAVWLFLAIHEGRAA